MEPRAPLADLSWPPRVRRPKACLRKLYPARMVRICQRQPKGEKISGLRPPQGLASHISKQKQNANRPTFHPSKGSRFLIVYFFLFLRASIAARPAEHRTVLNDAIISSDNRADSLSCSAVAIRKGLSPAVPISPIFACSSSDNSACFGSPAVNACALFCAEVAFRSIIDLYNA